MTYFIIYLFLYPILFILSFFRKKSNDSLIIQTAKIGDYVNTSIMFDALQSCDLIIDKINIAFAQNDNRINNIYLINDYKQSFLSKMKLAFIIYKKNYKNVYIVMPNNLNIFLGQMSFSRNKVTLKTYADKSYKKLYTFNMKKINHTTKNLTIETYLKMINETYTHLMYKKMVQKPLLIPKNSVINKDFFSIGISLTAANKVKTINIETWLKIFRILKRFQCKVYIFGLKNEKELYDNLMYHLGDLEINIISLLEKIELKYLPFEISKMDLYISSDTGNSYIADSMDVPTINFAGPCFWEEQRPVFEKSLIVKSNASCVPYSSVFHTVEIEKCKGLFDITKKQEEEIFNFIESLYTNFQLN